MNDTLCCCNIGGDCAELDHTCSDCEQWSEEQRSWARLWERSVEHARVCAVVDCPDCMPF